MTSEGAETRFVVHYDLNEARAHVSRKEPTGFQREAIHGLQTWYADGSKHFPEAGGVLVLPTGGGKTFTAFRFLCGAPLSDGYKLLWLAHTHPTFRRLLG